METVTTPLGHGPGVERPRATNLPFVPAHVPTAQQRRQERRWQRARAENAAHLSRANPFSLPIPPRPTVAHVSARGRATLEALSAPPAGGASPSNSGRHGAQPPAVRQSPMPHSSRRHRPSASPRSRVGSLVGGGLSCTTRLVAEALGLLDSSESGSAATARGGPARQTNHALHPPTAPMRGRRTRSAVSFSAADSADHTQGGPAASPPKPPSARIGHEAATRPATSENPPRPLPHQRHRRVSPSSPLGLATPTLLSAPGSPLGGATFATVDAPKPPKSASLHTRGSVVGPRNDGPHELQGVGIGRAYFADFYWVPSAPVTLDRRLTQIDLAVNSVSTIKTPREWSALTPEQRRVLDTIDIRRITEAANTDKP